MGNITKLIRGGANNGILNYTNYTGNQLNTVAGYSPRNYAYDANGNATSDGVINNPKTIDYNFLNLPRNVSNGLATYTFGATGNKLRNTGSDGNWDYIDGITYFNNSIKYITTDEGRATPINGGYNYQYDLKDHLGDVRVTFINSNYTAKVIQEDEYFPFGLRKPDYDNSNNNRHLYNSKELQVDLTNQYDYGARFYDPVIARWTNIDPLAEQYRKWTSYNYGSDNPIRYSDPDGMGLNDPVTTNQINTITYNKKSATYTINETTSVSSTQTSTITKPLSGTVIQEVTQTNTINSITTVNMKGDIVNKNNAVSTLITTAIKDPKMASIVPGSITKTETKSSLDNSITAPVASSFSEFFKEGHNAISAPIKDDQQIVSESKDLPGASDGATSGWGGLINNALSSKSSNNNFFGTSAIQSQRNGIVTSGSFNGNAKIPYESSLKSLAKKYQQ